MILGFIAASALYQWPNRPSPDDEETRLRFASNLRAVPVRYRPVFSAIVRRDYRQLVALSKRRVQLAYYQPLKGGSMVLSVGSRILYVCVTLQFSLHCLA